MKYNEYCCSCFAKTTQSTSINSTLCEDKDYTISSAFTKIFSKDLMSTTSLLFTEKMCKECISSLKMIQEFWTRWQETQDKFMNLLEEEKKFTDLGSLKKKQIQLFNDDANEFHDEEHRDSAYEQHADTESDNTHKYEGVKEKDSTASHERSTYDKSYNPPISKKKSKSDCRKSTINELSCDICDLKVTQKSKLTSHMLQHRKEKCFTCKDCKKVYSTRCGWKKHVDYVHLGIKQSKIKTFLCSTCGKNFTTKQRLEQHSLIHTRLKKFPCTLCDKAFATSTRLKNHIRVHTGERPYKCDECGKSFSQRNVLVCHIRLHTGEKPFQCNICQKVFRQYATLKTHMAIHTGKSIECPDCKKTFCRISFLHVHMRKHTGEKPYACDRCPNRYRQKCHLDQHMDTHDGIKYQCEVCKKKYSKKWSLKIHMYSHSEGNRFQCSECGSSFVRKDKYKRHLRTVHGKDTDTPSKFVLVRDSTAENTKSTNTVTYQLVEVDQESTLCIVENDENVLISQ